MNFTTSAPTRVPSKERGESNGHSLFAVPAPREPFGKVLFARLLWEHRRLLLRAAVFGAVLSTAVAFLIPTRYKAQTQLMPPDGQQGLGMALLSAFTSKGGSALGGLANDLLGQKNSGALFVGVLKSRTIADGLIDQFQLKRVYRDRKIEDTRDDLADHSDISEDRKSGILTVTVTDHIPERAQGMAQAYVAELNRVIAQVSTSSARRERIFLEGRLAEVKGELDSAARRFSDFASKNTAIDIPAQGKAMLEAAARLNGELVAAQAELSGLEQIYTANNVRVRALRARVQELQQQLQKMGGDNSTLSSDTGQMYPSIRKLPLLGVTYADLYRQTKIDEAVFELLTTQFEMAKVQEAKEIPTVKVLDPAVVPTKKSFPPRLIIIIAGMLLTVVAVAGWLWLQSRWDATDPDDPRRALAEEVGASVRRKAEKLRPIAAKVRLSRDSDEVKAASPQEKPA
jgi:uncharacterized protein involved in exopolysaccharide biosynthesis